MIATGTAADAPGARPVSGEQFVLHRGTAVARVGQVAAVLREYSVGTTAYTETWDDADLPPMGCGIVLVPWPNRVADGRWSHAGVTQQLDITEPGRGHASHGLLRNTAYHAVSVSPEVVTLAASVYPQHGYPFSLDTSVTYALTDDGLRVTHRISNVGSGPAPFGVGTHPYLRVGDVPVADLVLTVTADSTATVDERLIPTGLQPVGGGPLDLRSGVRLGAVSADAAFTDLDAARRPGRASVAGTRRPRCGAVGRRGVRLGAGVHTDGVPSTGAPGCPAGGRRRADDLWGECPEQRLGAAQRCARRDLVGFVGPYPVLSTQVSAGGPPSAAG